MISAADVDTAMTRYEMKQAVKLERMNHQWRRNILHKLGNSLHKIQRAKH